MGNFLAILLPILFTALLTPLFKMLIDYINIKNNKKIEIQSVIVNIYSPLVRYMDHICFLQNGIEHILDTFESHIYSNYNYMTKDVLCYYTFIKKKSVVSTVIPSVDLFFPFYFACQTQYHSAKCATRLPYDTTFLKFKDKPIYQYTIPVVGTAAFATLSLAFLHVLGIISYQTMTVSGSVVLMLDLLFILSLILTFIGTVPNQWVAKRRWNDVLLPFLETGIEQ